MIKSLLIGIVGIVGIAVLWMLVQLLWKQEFSEHMNDEDPLAERRSCSNCGCTTICTKKKEMMAQEMN